MKKESVSTFIKVVISLGLMAFLFYRFLSDPAEREILFNYLAGAILQ